MPKIPERGVSYWAIIVVLAFAVVAMIIAFWPQDEVTHENLSPVNAWRSARNTVGGLNEKDKIDRWIINNALNEYGDKADTVYAGGSPLFDEATGKTMGRYDYIKMNHPDRPWNK